MGSFGIPSDWWKQEQKASRWVLMHKADGDNLGFAGQEGGMVVLCRHSERRTGLPSLIPSNI